MGSKASQAVLFNEQQDAVSLWWQDIVICMRAFYNVQRPQLSGYKTQPFCNNNKRMKLHSFWDFPCIVSKYVSIGPLKYQRPYTIADGNNAPGCALNLELGVVATFFS